MILTNKEFFNIALLWLTDVLQDQARFELTADQADLLQKISYMLNHFRMFRRTSPESRIIYNSKFRNPLLGIGNKIGQVTILPKERDEMPKPDTREPGEPDKSVLKRLAKKVLGENEPINKDSPIFKKYLTEKHEE
jgi:hypothetical protein